MAKSLQYDATASVWRGFANADEKNRLAKLFSQVLASEIITGYYNGDSLLTVAALCKDIIILCIEIYTHSPLRRLLPPERHSHERERSLFAISVTTNTKTISCHDTSLVPVTRDIDKCHFIFCVLHCF